MDVFGRHSGPVAALAFDLGSGLVVSGCWRGEVKGWSLDGSCVCEVSLPSKVLCLAVSDGKLVVCTGNESLVYLSIREEEEEKGEEEEDSQPAFTMAVLGSIDSPLSSSSTDSSTPSCRAIQHHPSGVFFALSGAEGRVAVDLGGWAAKQRQIQDQDSSDKEEEEEEGEAVDSVPYSLQRLKPYTFRCHRVDKQPRSVNSVAFHPSTGTFASGGSDGCVFFWDAHKKKKLGKLSFPDKFG